MTALPQHMQALKSGNSKRLAVAEMIRETKQLGTYDATQRVITALVNDYDDRIIGTARIGRLLDAIHYLGQMKIGKCLRAAGVISGDVRVRDLTETQRGLIVFQLQIWSADKS